MAATASRRQVGHARAPLSVWFGIVLLFALVGVIVLASVGPLFFFSSRRRHTRLQGDWSSDVCSSDLGLFYPGGPLFDSITLRVVFTAAAVFIAIAALLLSAHTVKLWRNTSASTSVSIQASLVSIASVALAFCLATFWVPLSWRSTDRGIERLAERLHNAGISVETTLVAYETLRTPGRLRLLQDPAINYLRADTRDRWHRQPQAGIPGNRHGQFMEKVN